MHERDNVDAIIFAHSCKDNIEDVQINKFVSSTVDLLTEEQKSRLFFVMTHGTDKIKENEKTLEKANDIFNPKGIRKERILNVDSLLELVYRGVEKERRNPMDLLDSDDEVINNIMGKVKFQIEKVDKKECCPEEIQSKMLQMAGFVELRSILDRFAMTEKEESFRQLIQQIEESYKTMESSKNVECEWIKSKRTDSTINFEAKIAASIEKCKNYQLAVNHGSENIKMKYTSTSMDSVISKEFNLLKTDFYSKLEDANRELWNVFNDFCQRADNRTSGVARAIRIAFENLVEEANVEMEDLLFQKPTFDFVDMEAKAKQQATHTETRKEKKEGAGNAIKRFFFGWCDAGYVYKKYSVVNDVELRMIMIKEIKTMFNTFCAKLQSNLIHFAEQYATLFKEEVEKLMKAEQQSLEKWRERKATDEELKKQQAEVERLLIVIRATLSDYSKEYAKWIK